MTNSSPLNIFKQSLPVTCPSCAGTIGIMTPESFTLRPNNKFRGHLNSLIVDMRNFTRGLDAYLAVHTTSLPLHDVYGSPYARAEILSLINMKMIDKAALMDVYPDPGATGAFPQLVEETIESTKNPQSETGSIFSTAIERAYGNISKTDILKSIYNPHGEFLSIAKEKQPGTQQAFDHYAPRVRIWSEYFESQIDTHDFARNFSNLPRLDDQPKITVDWLKKTAKLFLGAGLERRVNGLVFDLALEQPQMRAFLRDHMTTETETLISAILDELRPSLNRYYRKFDEFFAGRDEDRAGMPVEEQKQVRENLRRARLLLLLLHGHVWQTWTEAKQKKFTDTYKKTLTQDFKTLFLGGIPPATGLWVIDERATIQPQLLARMLNSKQFFDGSNIALGEVLNSHQRTVASDACAMGILDKLRLLFFAPFRKREETSSETDRNIAWLKHVEEIVNVHCNSEIKSDKMFLESTQDGLAARIADFVSRRRKEAKLVKQEVYAPCDYQLTNQKTFSLVILGSMGAGKTCAFNSATATLWRFSEALMLDIEPTDNESLLKMEQIRDDHLKGLIELPTDKNFSLNIKLCSLPDASKHTSRVSILDIPGETVFSLISGTGADSELRRIMKSANAVVFLYDLWSDTAFSADVRKSNAKKLANGLTTAENTEKARENRQGTAVDQRMVLQRLYGLLKEERTEADLRKLPFVCAFPKADLLSGEDNDLDGPFIMNEFMKQLMDAGVFVTQEGGANASGIRSCAGLKPAPGPLKDLFAKYYPDNGIADIIEMDFQPDSLERMVRYQLALSRMMSEMFRELVIGKLQNMVGDRSEAEKPAFTSRIQSGVLEYLSSRFDQCYFLPVSALGKSPQHTDKGFQPLGQMPDSQLIEYSFLIPILESIKESLGLLKSPEPGTGGSGGSSSGGGSVDPATPTGDSSGRRARGKTP